MNSNWLGYEYSRANAHFTQSRQPKGLRIHICDVIAVTVVIVGLLVEREDAHFSYLISN